MDTEKLKHIEKRAQIISAIEKGAEFGGDVWQNSVSGRQLFQIISISADVLKDTFTFKILDMGGLDPHSPIFIRLCYRNIIFRLMPGQFKINGDKLICEYPREARALEPRKGERYVLPFSSDLSLSLKRSDRNIRGMNFDIEVKIIDVSESGFGILISGVNKDFLKKFDHFWINAIDHKPLYDQMYGTVTYVAPKGYYLKRGDVRVGLSLKKPLSHDVFEYLKSKCHLVLGV